MPTLRLPNLATSQPESGNDNIEPAGNANSMAPSCASLNCKSCCILGMRDAQLANEMPCKKNKVLIARRVVRLLGVYKVVVSCKFL